MWCKRYWRKDSSVLVSWFDNEEGRTEVRSQYGVKQRRGGATRSYTLAGCRVARVSKEELYSRW